MDEALLSKITVSNLRLGISSNSRICRQQLACYFLRGARDFRRTLRPVRGIWPVGTSSCLQIRLSGGAPLSCIYDLVRNQDTYRADVDQTVLDVARAMVERNIGAVPVLRDGLLVGVFSERDLMRRVVVEGRDPGKTKIAEVMTEDPLIVSPQEDMDTCRFLMHRHGFRHLPICEGKQLRGMVSLRDVIQHDLSEKDYEMRMMRAYIYSTP